MNSINYYKKYTKYKNKYLEIKNNLLGAGENGIIEFILKEEKKETPIEIGEDFISSLEDKKSVFIILKKEDRSEQRFSIKKMLGKGGNGIVFLLEDNKVIKLPLEFGNSITQEGKDEQFGIPFRSKALFQGDRNISFVIYNYLGNNLNDTLLCNSNQKNNLDLLFNIYKQLFDQIYGLNKNSKFHNDVKIQNCVILENTLSLIDFGEVEDFSFRGSYCSICIKGCIYWLKINFSSNLKKIQLDDCIIEYLLVNCVSTDIIGFFNFIIGCLLKNYQIKKTSYSLLKEILSLKGEYSFEDIIKMLCFLSIISSNKKPYDILSRNPYCNCIIQEIQKKLFIFNTCSSIYKLKVVNEGIFCYACFLYFNLEFQTQDQFLFLFNLVKKCFNSTFDLDEFKKFYDIILNKNLLEQQN